MRVILGQFEVCSKSKPLIREVTPAPLPCRQAGALTAATAELREASGGLVEVTDPVPGQTERVLSLRGTQQQVDDLIQRIVHKLEAPPHRSRPRQGLSRCPPASPNEFLACRKPRQQHRGRRGFSRYW